MALDVQLTWPALPIKLALRTPLDDDAIIARLHAVVGDLQAALMCEARDATRARELIRSLIEDVTITPIEEDKADGRGIGPVRITVTGSLTRALGLSGLSRVVQHSSRPESIQDHATVLVEFTIDLFPSDVRLEQGGGYAALAMMSRLLDDAAVPVSKNDFVDGLAEMLGETPDHSERSSHTERVRYGLEYFRKRRLLRRYGVNQTAGYMWADRAGPSLDAQVGQRIQPIHLPLNVVEVLEPVLSTVRVYRRENALAD